MNMQEKADYASSMINPNMERLLEFVMAEPSGKWTLISDDKKKREAIARELRGRLDWLRSAPLLKPT